MSAFHDMCKSSNYRGVRPDLKCIRNKGRPKADCPKWYMEGIEQADYAFQKPNGKWALTNRGRDILKSELADQLECDKDRP